MSPREPAKRALGALDSLLASLPPITLVVGKGGVGKTTCSIGLAARSSESGERTLLLSTDPAGALASALEVPLTDGESREVGARTGLFAQQLDARRSRREFLARWRETIVTIVDRGTYLDVEDIEGLVDATFPGSDEIFAVLALAALVAGGKGDRFRAGGIDLRRLIVDTAPTGHTLRLLALPETFEAMVALLDTMQAKHRFMVGALTRRYRADAADRFIDEMRATIAALRNALTDRARAAAILVTRAEPVVVAETARYAEALRALGLHVAAVIVNALPEQPDQATRAAVRDLAAIAGEAPCLSLPRFAPAPRGLPDVVRVMRELGSLKRKGIDPGVEKMGRGRKGWRQGRTADVSSLLGGGPHAPRLAPDLLPSLLRTLTVVGGKGGVGKTTVSTALAIAAASSGGGPVLLVSTDPAPSIADALGVEEPGWARAAALPVSDVPGLFAWQMDASVAFAELRDRYRGRIDALFDAFVGRGVDVAHDRAILRDLLALAPPGIDELYALASLGETLDDRRYGRIIIDPAPTGHLLRLLEMPALALDWSHRLMRMMLKYKDVAGLGDAAQDLLAFSKRTRSVEALLHDPERAGVVLVTLDEPLVRAEALRLAAALRAARVAITGVIENRVADDASDATITEVLLPESVPHIAAPAYPDPLVGLAAIQAWSARWYQVRPETAAG